MRSIRLLMFRLVRSAVIVRRVYSVPEHITMFSAGAVAVGAVYPAIMAHTGGPCPFCGLTTATVALAHGQWSVAAATSPLVCLVALMVTGTAPVLAARAAGMVSLPRPASDHARRRITRVMYVIAALNWVFELHRYGFA